MIGLCRERRVFIKLKGGTAREASIFETSHTPFCETERRFCGLWSKEVAQPGSTFCLFLPYRLIKSPLNGLADEQPGVVLNSLNEPLFIVFDSTCLWTMDTVLPLQTGMKAIYCLVRAIGGPRGLLLWRCGRIAKMLWMWMKMLRGQSDDLGVPLVHYCTSTVKQ